MRFTKAALGVFLSLLPVATFAEPEDDLREAVSALARTSYRWETTVRQKFSGETADPKLNANAPAEVEGRVGADGFSQITLLPSRELPVPVTVVFQHGDALARTPLGWLRRTEIRQTPGTEREVTFEGKQVRLSRFFTAALKVTTLRPLTEDLFDLVTDLKSCRRADSTLVIAELRDATIEKLWGDAQASRAPEIRGTVVFKITDAGVTEGQFLLAIGFPNSRTKKTAWSVQQWSTRISGIGSTTVELPEAAITAFEK